MENEREFNREISREFENRESVKGLDLLFAADIISEEMYDSFRKLKISGRPVITADDMMTYLSYSLSPEVLSMVPSSEAPSKYLERLNATPYFKNSQKHPYTLAAVLVGLFENYTSSDFKRNHKDFYDMFVKGEMNYLLEVSARENQILAKQKKQLKKIATIDGKHDRLINKFLS